ncbi:MAG: bifunctional 4-hydroxy-2-oxoglutarate aldolase/2-dehydro-3-deoxy-phosphogluconate aldolase [Alkalispirochaetaceae bacterium]
MKDPIEIIRTHGLVPVIKLDSADSAVPLAGALQEAGLPVAEITFRTDAAEESIKRVAKELPEVALGAGTVLTVDQAKRAVDAGAAFIVTPGFNPKVVEYCVKHQIPITPGVNNPTAVEQALDFDLKTLKFFPAEASGGVKMLKALGGPYGGVSFVPTGGVNADNLSEYLALKNVAAVGGSWMVPSAKISAGEFNTVVELTREALGIVRSVRGSGS